MKKFVPLHSRRIVAIAVLTLLIGTGCGIALPTISLTRTVLNDVEIAPLLELPVGIPVTNLEVSLGELCDIPTLDDLIARAEEELGFSIPVLISLDAVLIDEFVFTATEGDFGFVTAIELLLAEGSGVPGEEDELRSLGTATPEGPDNTILRFTPNGDLDLLDILPEEGCAEGIIRLTGTVPTETVVFDGELSMSIKVSIWNRTQPSSRSGMHPL